MVGVEKKQKKKFLLSLKNTTFVTMKLWAIVFFLLPLLGAGYVSWRIWQLLPFASWIKACVVGFVWLGLVVMVCNFAIGLDRLPLSLAQVLYEWGNSWLFVMLYLVIIFLVLDLGRLVRLVPKSVLVESPWGTLGIFLLVASLFIYGYAHYLHKERVVLTMTTEKPLAKPVKIVMMSDLHLGYHNRKADFAKWVDLVNLEQPDMILIAGDIVDISVRPLIEENVAEEFRRLQAPVYACLGNHEYYSGEPQAQQFYRDANIHLLRDSAVTVKGISIVGRDDRTNPSRKAIGKLMQQVDKSKYTILLDHQPYFLEQAERNGVDFQFSGHTHHGQVWPISWITDALYECAFGEYQRGNTRYYVSSGIGLWGGKFRIGTQSEYVVAVINNGQWTMDN
jgi:predicted MPP superfamily phosphohydrolase